MKKSPEIKALHDKRWELIFKVREQINTKDSKKKFENLIKICKEFSSATDKLNELGENVTIGAKKYQTDYWKIKYKEYINNTKETTKSKDDFIKPIKNIEKTLKSDDVNLYYIMLCWTIQNDYCVCDNIIDTVKNYFDKMKLEFADTASTKFPDRTEYISTYKLKSSNDVYKTIIDSAEYIIDINTDSIHEKCNVGVFGKKLN